jgi:transposase-like protein
MDKDRLADRLAAGDSIEAIARDVGRHPSTVAYWVGKHGLRSMHADRHAARGGIERAVLAALVEEGLTVRAIAAKLDVSAATVRHWLGVHGLRTHRAATGQAVRATLRVEEGRATAVCPVHGATTFAGSTDGGWRCIACRSERVSQRRRTIKATLVAEAGGACVLCGYDRCSRALGFHHVDPSTKEFGLAFRGMSRSIARARAEARKCVLLCSNCHMEVEAGLAAIPLVTSAGDPPR